MRSREFTPQIMHIITSLEEGGAEAVLYRLCLYGPNGRQKVICLMGEGKYGSLLRKVGVTVSCLGLRRGQLTVAAVFLLFRILLKEKPDVVQTWMYHSDLVGGVAARLAGVRHVVWGVRTSQLDSSTVTTSTRWAIRAGALLSWLVPDYIVTCANRAAQVHKNIGYQGRRFVVIPNGYDLEVFKPNREAALRLRSQIGLHPKSPLLGMVARFDPQKDHRTFLEALVILRESGIRVKSLLVGSGLDKSNQLLMNWLYELRLEKDVHLLSSREDVSVVMSALTLHVLSSVCEAFPNVLAEAMACGVPCVATDVGDSGLIVDKFGWLVPSKDPVAMATALSVGLHESPAHHEVRRHQARSHIANHFSIDHMVRNYMELYGGLTNL